MSSQWFLSSTGCREKLTPKIELNTCFLPRPSHFHMSDSPYLTREPVVVAKRARRQPKALNGCFLKEFRKFSKEMSQVRSVMSKVKIVTFRLTGYWDGTKNSCEPKLCQNAYQVMTNALHKYMPYTKHRSRSSWGQTRLSNENVVSASCGTCLVGHLGHTIRCWY